jgi:hypothetical protein
MEFSGPVADGALEFSGVFAAVVGGIAVLVAVGGTKGPLPAVVELGLCVSTAVLEGTCAAAPVDV